ncbi:MAG: aldolase catalytic domain-containing protein [Oscillospiraceae bacterium]|nr:aldolase catalytic domain-containing protein [Oscillospiraceae bacterium]
MKKIMLLDCTLRDGGYVNDWNFGHNNLVSIFERLAEAMVDIIEIGFLDERRNFDPNRSIMPDTDCVSKIYGRLDRKNSMVVGMIDYGTCSLSNIRPCEDSYLDGIRVIFKKHLRKPALEFCAELKKLGYKVFAQLVSVTSYTDEEILDLISIANEVKPYAVSMVDTYGLMHQNNLNHYFRLLDENLCPQINLGYHAHNNFQMGYANCIAMLANSTKRNIIVDGSLYGMGKSAGNAPVELIAMHINHSYGHRYHISQLLEAIDSNISQFYTSATWGYNMFYYLAASNDCHPNYVSYLTEKRTLSVKSVNELLGRLEGEKKLLFDKKYIELLYLQYLDNEVNDTQTVSELEAILSGRPLMIIGPGSSVRSEKAAVDKYISANSPVIISINYIPDNIRPDYVFVSNSKRYVQMATELANSQFTIIATSNVTSYKGSFDYIVNVSPLLDLDAEIIDNSLTMLLRLLIKTNIKDAALAGFDGYSKVVENYAHPVMEYSFAKEKADYLNKYTTDFIGSIKDKMTLSFVTKSRYACGGSYEQV